MTFDELYQQKLYEIMHGNDVQENPNDGQLDCLLHPERYAAIVSNDPNKICENCTHDCVGSCVFDAIEIVDGKPIIDQEKCAGCSRCVEVCKDKTLTVTKDAVAAMKAVRAKNSNAYALIAPAFLGQFSKEVTPGKLRNALKALGFDGMIEVALFADILTLKEAIEFDKNILTDNDYQLTSCCCPMWIAMIKRVYHKLMPHVPGSVSPMIACGRVIKKLYPNALTVFVGPCLAKKSEARETDIAGAVDYVLTFQEVEELFKLANIDPKNFTDDEKSHSSRAGRIYARAGGVAEAVQQTVARIAPDKTIALRARKAEGVPGCRSMLEELSTGTQKANFYEGMGCIGGCVGGPKAIINKDEATINVDRYADIAQDKTPSENQYVYQLLERLGIHSAEELTESSLFTRYFD